MQCATCCIPGSVIAIDCSAVRLATAAVRSTTCCANIKPYVQHASISPLFSVLNCLLAVLCHKEPPCQPSSSPSLAVLQPLLGQQQQDHQQHQQGYTVTDAAAADAMPAWQLPGPWAQVRLSTNLCVPVKFERGAGRKACLA